MYNFHKKKSTHCNHVFEHPQFLKNHKELIKNIRRKNKTNNINNLPFFNFNSNNKDKIESIKQNNIIPLDENTKQLSNFGSPNNNITNTLENQLIEYKAPLYNYILNYPNYITPYNQLNASKSSSINELTDLNNISNITVNNESINQPIINNLLGNKKITKKDLEDNLNNLIKEMNANQNKQKELELKIEKLKKQNEQFLIQNRQMLNEVRKKNDYNKNLERVVYFIVGGLANKQNKFNNKDNYLLDNENSISNNINGMNCENIKKKKILNDLGNRDFLASIFNNLLERNKIVDVDNVISYQIMKQINIVLN